MEIIFEFVNGISFGIEHIGRDDEAEIDESVIMITFGFFRWMIWLGDYDQ